MGIDMSTVIMEEWIIPILKYGAEQNFSKLRPYSYYSALVRHIKTIIVQVLKDLLFEPVILTLVDNIELLKDYDDFLMKSELGTETTDYYKDMFGSYLSKIIKEVEKARINEVYLTRSRIQHEEFDTLRKEVEGDLNINLGLKWTEHHSWIQVKTVLDPGDEIKKYGIDIDGGRFRILILTTNSKSLYGEIDLYRDV